MEMQKKQIFPRIPSAREYQCEHQTGFFFPFIPYDNEEAKCKFEAIHVDDKYLRVYICSRKSIPRRN